VTGGVRIRRAAVSLWVLSALAAGSTAARAEESGDHLKVERADLVAFVEALDDTGPAPNLVAPLP
jgi:hypothetical protein